MQHTTLNFCVYTLFVGISWFQEAHMSADVITLVSENHHILSRTPDDQLNLKKVNDFSLVEEKKELTDFTLVQNSQMLKAQAIKNPVVIIDNFLEGQDKDGQPTHFDSICYLPTKTTIKAVVFYIYGGGYYTNLDATARELARMHNVAVITPCLADEKDLRFKDTIKQNELKHQTKFSAEDITIILEQIDQLAGNNTREIKYTLDNDTIQNNLSVLPRIFMGGSFGGYLGLLHATTGAHKFAGYICWNCETNGSKNQPVANSSNLNCPLLAISARPTHTGGDTRLSSISVSQFIEKARNNGNKNYLEYLSLRGLNVCHSLLISYVSPHKKLTFFRKLSQHSHNLIYTAIERLIASTKNSNLKSGQVSAHTPGLAQEYADQHRSVHIYTQHTPEQDWETKRRAMIYSYRFGLFNQTEWQQIQQLTTHEAENIFSQENKFKEYKTKILHLWFSLLSFPHQLACPKGASSRKFLTELIEDLKIPWPQPDILTHLKIVRHAIWHSKSNLFIKRLKMLRDYIKYESPAPKTNKQKVWSEKELKIWWEPSPEPIEKLSGMSSLATLQPRNQSCPDADILLLHILLHLKEKKPSTEKNKGLFIEKLCQTHHVNRGNDGFHSYEIIKAEMAKFIQIFQHGDQQDFLKKWYEEFQEVGMTTQLAAELEEILDLEQLFYFFFFLRFCYILEEELNNPELWQKLFAISEKTKQLAMAEGIQLREHQPAREENLTWYKNIYYKLTDRDPYSSGDDLDLRIPIKKTKKFRKRAREENARQRPRQRLRREAAIMEAVQ